MEYPKPILFHHRGWRKSKMCQKVKSALNSNKIIKMSISRFKVARCVATWHNFTDIEHNVLTTSAQFSMHDFECYPMEKHMYHSQLKLRIWFWRAWCWCLSHFQHTFIVFLNRVSDTTIFWFRKILSTCLWWELVAIYQTSNVIASQAIFEQLCYVNELS